MKKVLLLVMLLVFFAGLTLSLLQRPPAPLTTLSPDILQRSVEYVHKLGDRPLTQMGLEDKLLLLHSYANLRQYKDVLRVAATLGAAFKQLPPERQEAFRAMIDEAKRYAPGP